MKKFEPTSTLKPLHNGNGLYIFNSLGQLIYKRWGSNKPGRMFYENEGKAERLKIRRA